MFNTSFTFTFLPRDALSALRDVRPSVRLSVTLVYRGRMRWVSSKVITRIISSGSSLLQATTSANLVQGEHPQIRMEWGLGRSFQRKPPISLKRSKI